MLKTNLSLALFAAAVVVAAPAHARGERELVTARVAFADLDLSSHEGQVRLDRRVGAAIDRLCGSTVSVDLRGVADRRRCRVEANADYRARRERLLASRGTRSLTIAAR